jgi:hypothetical protein
MKNKILNTTLFAFILTLGFVGCEDFVDYEAKENYQIIADDYFKSSDDYDAALIGVYDPLQWLYFNSVISDVASDNSFCGGETASDVLGLQEIDDMKHRPENDQLTQVWRSLYEGINRANYMVENKDKLDFDGKTNVYAQVYFLRAFYYSELVKFFGDVPLFTEARLTASDSGTLSRTPAVDVYAQIETDLLAAISDLPSTQSQKGRATKYAAQALLGKVYLFQDKFAESASILESVIGVYSLVDDFESIFLKSGENGPESVFEIQYSNESNWYDWNCATCGEGNFQVIHNGPRAFDGPSYATGWSINTVTQDLVDAYEDGDSRKDATILDIQAFADANTDWNDGAGVKYATAWEHTGYYNKKYIPRAGESGAQIELNYLNNFRVIRYSDVLLMAAEANNRKASPDDSKARTYLNQVRQRAFGDDTHDISDSGTTLTNAIWTERRLEFAMEGHRFFDLVRTGQAASTIAKKHADTNTPNDNSIIFVSGKHELFPIPQQEIDISKLEQNNY